MATDDTPDAPRRGGSSSLQAYLLSRLEKEVEAIDKQVDANRSDLERHEEQLNGARGISAALEALAIEVRSLRRAAYWVAGVIVVASITFAFSVLQLVH